MSFSYRNPAEGHFLMGVTKTWGYGKITCWCSSQLMPEKGIYLIYRQHATGDDALLQLTEVSLVQATAVSMVIFHKHLKLGSDWLCAVGIGVVREEIIIGTLQQHLTGEHSRTPLYVRVYLGINHHRTYQYPIVRHSCHNEKLLMVNACPRTNEHGSGNH